MKITYAEVPALYGAYLSLGDSEISGWSKVIKNGLALKKHSLESKERQRKVVEKYAEKDKKGNYILEEDENGIQRNIFKKHAKKAQEDMNELMKQEVKVDLVVLGPKDLLANNKKPVALKPAEMLPLYEKKLIS